jgi:hypothetical protein
MICFRDKSSQWPASRESNLRGALYHVIARGNHRRDIFRDEAHRVSYLERIEHYRERYRWTRKGIGYFSFRSSVYRVAAVCSQDRTSLKLLFANLSFRMVFAQITRVRVRSFSSASTISTWQFERFDVSKIPETWEYSFFESAKQLERLELSVAVERLERASVVEARVISTSPGEGRKR